MATLRITILNHNQKVNVDDISAYTCSQLKDIIINKPSNLKSSILLSVEQRLHLTKTLGGFNIIYIFDFYLTKMGGRQ